MFVCTHSCMGMYVWGRMMADQLLLSYRLGVCVSVCVCVYEGPKKSIRRQPFRADRKDPGAVTN